MNMLELTVKWGSEKCVEAFSSQMPLKQKHILLSTYAHSIMHFTTVNAYMYVCVYIFIHTEQSKIYLLYMYVHAYIHP